MPWNAEIPACPRFPEAGRDLSISVIHFFNLFPPNFIR